MANEHILVIGANGQIGSVLVAYLRDIYGESHVVAGDIRIPEQEQGIFVRLDATDANALAAVVAQYKITQIYHLAAILSANGEKEPLKTWDINMQTYFNVLEVAREYRIAKVFYPSSIAVFGSGIEGTALQEAPLHPTTVYGISKVAGENWSQYYHSRYGLDIRSLRFPGIISHQSAPGGGTTDYAVDIYHQAVKGIPFTCFLASDTRLPMIYIDDAIHATVNLMEAEANKITIRNSYNLAAMSFSPREIAHTIREYLPNFEIGYQPDFRQSIADSWPDDLDDTAARTDWGWRPAYDLDKTTREMIGALNQKYQTVKD
ncbi:nucleoside-diphosphate-sugar epimerase [Dyadobacter jejuensis]|uniref:Nucleoside-diphosphate-sugar epimerase n=1 Tax=Dyadobacter jejuensis TaxID=1082580 RepID=A0A316BCS8_9BACT|nr:NAD-dependent epimerase/dehydratase family protein [Dyadobacter jejuensis]PWJ60267.1 nucleoside-diphosphate-sugar epimerase [Dyadobacter jejuensis]